MISLRLLGPIELHDPDGRELRAVLTQPKRLALLTYLAHAPGQSFRTRDRLLGLLWPELDESRGRAALSQALYFLRQELGPDALTSRGADEVAVNPAMVCYDATQFRSALADGQEARALELYRGDFLEGQHLVEGNAWQEWVEGKRAELRALAGRAAWHLAAAEEAAGRRSAAASRARRALALSGPDERALRSLLELLDRSGDRAGAIHAYEEFAERLARDYELEVSPETRALVSRIRGRSEPRAEGRSTASEEPSGDPARPTGGARRRETTRASPAGVSLRGGMGFRASGTRRRWRLVVLPALALALIAVLPFAERPGADASRAARVAGPPVRLAVLPFENFGEDPTDLYLADGMTEELIFRLSSIGGVQVIARTSVMPYRGSDKTVAEIGEELNVPYVLEGSVRRDGTRLRFTVQLIDSRSQEHVWARNFDGEAGDVLRLQGEIAEQVANALPVEPIEEERRRLARRVTSDPEAHLSYLRGRHMLARGEVTAFAHARRSFEHALERDPTYARAWSGLAAALSASAWARVVPADAAHSQARAAAERALALDPDLADAHAALAGTLSTYFWEFEEAESHFRRAIELDPSNAEARRSYADHLMVNDRSEEARTQSLKAVELDPLSYFTHVQLVLEAFLAHRLEEAWERAQVLVRMRPDAAHSRFLLARIGAERGDFAQALRELDRVDPERIDAPALATRGYIHARRGDRTKARAIVARLNGPSFESGTDFESAIVLLALGERPRALDRLEAAVDRRDPRARLLLREPVFNAVQEDPGFKALVERVGLGVDREDPNRRTASVGTPR